ncbi:MAG TPA: alpha-1,2-fucosyltransferase [Puia sp.]|nr:alpha-1,2-fucosyltransferase [Puia sp.]
MFGVKIEGRLGNQLFQYAFALAQAARLEEDFFLDGYRYGIFRDDFMLDKYFTISDSYPHRNRLRKLLFLRTTGCRPERVVQDQWLRAEDFLREFSRPGILYSGFFQSEEYFLPVRDRIVREFRVRRPYQADIRSITGNTRETVVVHVRRTDYLHWGNEDLQYDLTLPDAYYHRCLSQVDLSGKNILFLSDDIAYVKRHLALPGAIFSEKNSQMTDLQFLMQADYLILSNSSFSWWGAYLNERVRRVFAPEYWLGFKAGREWPAGVIHPSWHKIPVI